MKKKKLRSQVSKLQSDRSSLLNDIAKKRAKAKNDLLKTLNPLLEQYMKEKNIKMVIDKKNLVVASNELDLTKEIIKLLNAKIKSLNY